MNLVAYFDREFASHITGLIDGQALEVESDDSIGVLPSLSDNRDDFDVGVVPHPVHPRKPLVRQGGKGKTRNEDDHGSDGDVDSRSSIRNLVLLSASLVWDEVVITAGLRIPPSRWESLRSICDEAPFVRSHLPKTLSVLLDGSRQERAALFCLAEITGRSTKLMVFSKLLPHSLSHATQSPRLTTAINKLLASDRELYERLPSNTQKAISDYVAHCSLSISSSPVAQVTDSNLKVASSIK